MQSFNDRPDYLIRRLDFAEKILLTAAFSVFCYRMAVGYAATGNPMNLLYLLDQFVVVVFIVFRRRARSITLRFTDWAVGLLGTFLSMLLGPVTAGNALAPASVTAFLWLIGFCLHMSAKVSLRRSFGVVAANRGVKSSGAYRFVRHPMYAGYMLVHLAFWLAGPNVYNTMLIAVIWALFVMRIVAEERILQQDEDYQALMQQTRYRLVPGIY